jgi:hypothetical protein
VYDFLVVDISHLHNELFHNRVLNFLSSFSGKDQNIAVLISLSTANMDKPSGAVDIPNLEMGPLLKPEAAGVDGGKTRPVSEQAHTRQDTAHLIGT